MEKQGEWWGYCFLVLTFFLITSVIVLVLILKGKSIGELKDFQNETTHLTWILVIFVATYLLRSISDILIVPKLMEEENLKNCILKKHPTLCASF